jgi:hypothetical protein
LKEKAAADLDNARRTAALNARQAYLGVSSGLAQVKAYEAAITSSQSAVDSNKLGYEVGVRINIDVLNAQSQLFRHPPEAGQGQAGYPGCPAQAQGGGRQRWAKTTSPRSTHCSTEQLHGPCRGAAMALGKILSRAHAPRAPPGSSSNAATALIKSSGIDIARPRRRQGGPRRVGEIARGRADQNRRAAGGGLDQVLAAEIEQAAADEGEVRRGVVGEHFAHAVADQYVGICQPHRLRCALHAEPPFAAQAATSSKRCGWRGTITSKGLGAPPAGRLRARPAPGIEDQPSSPSRVLAASQTARRRIRDNAKFAAQFELWAAARDVELEVAGDRDTPRAEGFSRPRIWRSTVRRSRSACQGYRASQGGGSAHSGARSAPTGGH